MSVNNKRKCRTCLELNSSLRPLSTKPKMLKINKTYMELLKFVANIEIDADGEEAADNSPPAGICYTCCKKIRDSYIFIKQVRNCNKQYAVDVKASLERQGECPRVEKVTPRKCEEPFIKQDDGEIDLDILNHLKEEMDPDACSSITKGNFDNIPPELNDTDMQQSSVKEPCPDLSIKTELESTNDDLLPVCVLNETTFAEDNLNSDTDSDIDNYDPLDDHEIDEEETNVPVDDTQLTVPCDECKKLFSNSILLNRHKRNTHVPDELKIQCPSCPVKFSRRYNMYAHMRTFHKTETVREHQIQPRNLPKTDVCDQCNRSYSDKYKLMAHIKNKHGPDSKPKKRKQQPKQYLCTLCGLTCSTQSNLDIHYRRHTGEKPFKCDFCARAYARLYDVQVHRRIHTGETPFKCTICEKAFKRSNKLKIHMRTHTNERPYKCTQCEKAFKQSKDLNIHKRTHTGERPYKCGVCNSTFTQSNSLKLHQTKTKHLVISNQEPEFTDITNTLP